MNLKVLGVAKVSLRNPKNKKKYRAEFAIIDEDYTPLLGSSTGQQMGLIAVQQETSCKLRKVVMNLIWGESLRLTLMSSKVWVVWKERFT